MSRLYTYRVEFEIHFVRYKEDVMTVTSQQAREMIKMRYPEAHILGCTEIKTKG